MLQAAVRWARCVLRMLGTVFVRGAGLGQGWRVLAMRGDGKGLQRQQQCQQKGDE